MVVRDLITQLGFDVDTYGLKKYDEALNNTMKTTSTLAKVVGAVGLALSGASIFKLGASFFRGAGEIEQIETTLTASLGSLDKAKQLIVDITSMAEKTPFQLMDLARFSKQLVAAKVSGEDIIEVMTNLGNVAAGVGLNKMSTITRAFIKIKNKGRASMEELNMMLEAGVPILDEVASVMDMKLGPALFRTVEKGAVGFDIVNQAIENLTTGTGIYANLMVKQSKTFLGLLSNIKDVFTNLVNAIGKELLPEGKRLAVLFLEWITLHKELIKIKVSEFYMGILKALKKVIDFFDKFKIIGNIGDMLKFLISILNLFGDRITKVFFKDGRNLIDFLSEWFKDNKELIAQNIAKFLLKTADAFEMALRVVKKLWPAILIAYAAFKSFKTILTLVDIVKFLVNPTNLIIAGIVLLIAAIVWATTHWDDFIAMVKEKWTELKDFFKEKATAMLDFITRPFVVAYDVVRNIIQGIKELWGSIVDGSLFLDINKSGTDFLKDAAERIKASPGKSVDDAKTFGAFMKNLWDADQALKDELLENMSKENRANRQSARDAEYERNSAEGITNINNIDNIDNTTSNNTRNNEILDNTTSNNTINNEILDNTINNKTSSEIIASKASEDIIASKGAPNTPVQVNNNIKVEATIPVPEGTTQEQSFSIKRNAEDILGATLDKYFNAATTPGLEAY